MIYLLLLIAVAYASFIGAVWYDLEVLKKNEK